MSAAAVAQKYAKALFDESMEQGLLQSVGTELRGLRDLERADSDLGDFMVNPEVPTEDKHTFLDNVFGNRLNPLVLNFLHLLVEKKRMGIYGEIVDAFAQLIDDHEGILRARVISATPLSASQQTRLVGELKRITGKQVEARTEIDAALLGGVVVHLGNQIIDRSVRRGLAELSELLRRTELSESKPA